MLALDLNSIPWPLVAAFAIPLSLAALAITAKLLRARGYTGTAEALEIVASYIAQHPDGKRMADDLHDLEHKELSAALAKAGLPDPSPPTPPAASPGAGGAAKLGMLLFALVLVSGCCVTRSEYKADVQAWRSFHQAVEPDLLDYYTARDPDGRYIGLSVIPPSSSASRLQLLERDEPAAIAAASSRSQGLK